MFIRQLQLFIIIIIINFTLISTSQSQADGSSYDYALTLYNSDKFDESIVTFTDLIQSGDLDESKLSTAFLYRGISYYKTNNYVNSITDLTNSLWLNSLDDENKKLAYETRASARYNIGHSELAEQDKLYVSNTEKDNDFKFNISENQENIVNLSDIEVSNKINLMNNSFSKSFNNFFGRKNADDKKTYENTDIEEIVSEDIIVRPGLFENIVNNDSKQLSTITLSEVPETSDSLVTQNNDPSIKKETQVKTVDIIRKIDEDQSDRVTIDKSILSIVSFFKNNIKSNKEVPKVASEPLKYHGYIELGMFNNQYDAKVSLGEIIIKHYVALSGLTPYIEEVIVDGIQMMYVIKLGPFNNRERVDFICDKFIAASDSCIKI